MKTFGTLFSYYLQNRASRRNLRLLLRFAMVLAVLVALYCTIFHYVMLAEGKEYSWITGVYWTLTVMSTTGFGDITFDSDVGRAFSSVVLLSGLVFLLVLLPFTLIELFYEPWVKAQAKARVPRNLSENTTNHVVLTRYGRIGRALIERLKQYNYPYVVIVQDLAEALLLHDEGITVVVGELDDPTVYQRVRVREAALVTATQSDTENTGIVFAVREVSKTVPILASADSRTSVEVLKLAGCTRVLEFSEMMGQALARRTRGGDTIAHVVGEMDDVLIAEAVAAETDLIGQTLRDAQLRNKSGVTVVGVWERGRFELAQAETVVGPSTVLVVAGSKEQVLRFDELYHKELAAPGPVVIIGGGRVGMAVARALESRRIDYRIVEQKEQLARDSDHFVVGDAANAETLERAGIEAAPAVVITPHDDGINTYLTILCRRVNPSMQIICRANLGRNVPTMHRAGCDFAVSYATMGASILFNLLNRSDMLMVAEGLNVFTTPVPKSLANKTVGESSLRHDTGCSIVAVNANGETVINPNSDYRLPAGGELMLIGTVEGENKFLAMHAKR